MAAQNPRQFDQLFAKSFGERDTDGILALYEPDATLVGQPGSPVTGLDAMREALAPFLGMGGQLDLRTVEVIESGDVALLLSDWSLTGGTDPEGNAADIGGRSTVVLRRQADGSWLAVIDHPFTGV